MPDLCLDKGELKELLDRASGAVASSGAHPALQCFHFSVRKSSLTVTTSDQANTIVVTVPGEFGETFDFLAPAAKLTPVVRMAQSGLIQLTVEKSVLSVVSGNTSWDIKMPAVTFPKVPKPVKPDVEIDGALLRAAIKATRKSMSDSAMRPPLRMLSIRKGSMTACDGARLSQASLGENFPRDFVAAIPFNSVGLVWELVKDESVTSVGIADLDNYCSYTVNNVQVMTKKLSASFPNVEQILLRPALENKQEFIVDRAELIKAIDRVRINSDAETDSIGLALCEKSVTVLARDADGNTSSDVIPSSWTGKDRNVAVNHKYLTGMLRGVDCAECHFFLGEDTKSRKSVLLMKDEEAGVVGLLPQFSSVVRLFS